LGKRQQIFTREEARASGRQTGYVSADLEIRGREALRVRTRDEHGRFSFSCERKMMRDRRGGYTCTKQSRE
jgi:hypothetical protein